MPILLPQINEIIFFLTKKHFFDIFFYKIELDFQNKIEVLRPKMSKINNLFLEFCKHVCIYGADLKKKFLSYKYVLISLKFVLTL